MGYNVHITRRDNWSDDGGPAIAESEWEDAVAMAPALAGFAEAADEPLEGPWFLGWT